MSMYLGKHKVNPILDYSYVGIALNDFLKVRGCNSLLSDNLDLTNTDNMLYFEDTQGVQSFWRMFGGDRNLIRVNLFDTSSATVMSNMFENCSSLVVIPAFDVSNVTDLGDFVRNCSNIAEIHIKNIGVSLNISSCTKMSRESIVEVLNNLKTVTTDTTLTLGTTLLEKLNEEDRKIATDKGWTLK